VHAEEFLVHDRHKGKCIECRHTLVVHFLAVLDDALLAESEMLGQMAALVVSSKQED